MKRFMLLLLMVVTCLMCISCGQEKKETSTTTENKAEVKEETKEEVATEDTSSEEIKDELIMSMGAHFPGDFDPRKRWGKYNQANILHSTLLKKDKDINIVGDLATGFEVSEDGLTWTLPVRKDIKFSNGEDVTMDDIVFTYEMLKEDGTQWDFGHVDKIEATEDHKIVFHLTEPNSAFYAILTEVVIVPEKYYDDNYSDNPIGSGPYKLVQYDRGQQAIFEVNPYYYGETPHFKKFTLLLLEEEAAIAAVRSGQVDMISVIPAHADEKIDGFKLFQYESNDVRGMSMPVIKSGTTHESGNPEGNDVTSDIAIRKALYIGIDRETIVESALNGYGKKAFTIVDKMPWWNEETAIEDNRVDEAKELLEEAGWKLGADGIREKDGLKAEFKLYYPAPDKVRTDVAINIAEMAKPLGINIELVASNWDEIQNIMYANAVLFAGGRHHPLQLMDQHHPDALKQVYGNIVNYHNPIPVKYMEQAIVATNPEEANELWKKAQWDGKEGLSGLGDAPYIWAVRLDHLYFGNEKINVGEQQIHSHGHDWALLHNIAEWTWDK